MRKRLRRPTHPGGILRRHYLEPLPMTVSGLAVVLGVSRKTLSEIVNEHASITPGLFVYQRHLRLLLNCGLICRGITICGRHLISLMAGSRLRLLQFKCGICSSSP
jgi:addiction module HigA family antidote